MRKHFAFVAMPAHGHVNPTLPLVEELVRRGHRVSYATGPAMLTEVEAAGATPVPLPWEIRADALSGADGSVEGLVAVLERFLDDVGVVFPELLARFEADRPDAVCYDVLSFLGSLLASRLGVPDAALVPSFASNEHFQFSLFEQIMPATFDPDHPKLVELMTKVEAFAAEFGVPGELVPTAATIAPLNLVFIPRRFQIARDTFDDRFVFIGPSLAARTRRETWQPPRSGSPVLFVSLGTAFNDRPDFFVSCVKAFGDGDWHVAMAIGDQVRMADLGEIPANFDVRPYFPQLAVLRHATAFVSHAGMNSIMEAVSCQVPVVAVPLTPEQVANAGRAEELGLCRRLDAESLTPELLRKTVDQVAADADIRVELARMSREIAACPGAGLGADALEKHVG